MKNDNYLNLCLEQAAKSPLRYRHGSIIVRGGKVIGQGYNDHRPGFDGGALKTGRLPNHRDTSAIAGVKQRQKMTGQSKSKGPEKNEFTPFEGMGGCQLANTPLSMHSEMMAIHSALSASSTLASSAVSSLKPCFKLPGDSKQKARLRRDAIKVYVEQICRAALTPTATEQLQSPSSVQEWRFEGATPQPSELESGTASRGRQRGRCGLERGSSTEKHRLKNRKIKSHDSGRQYKGQHKHVCRQSPHKLSAQGIVAPCHSKMSVVGQHQQHPGNLSSFSESIEDDTFRRSRKTKAEAAILEATAQPMLIPKRHTAGTACSVAERKKHPRLNGADLYVTRLGWKCSSPSQANVCYEVPAKPECYPLNLPTPSTGSLHDELISARRPTESMTNLSQNKYPKTVDDKQTSVLASRPCYRCISYMHSVGIKRVFWTTDNGTWEAAKVRDLVQALDNLGGGGVSDTAAALANVFVTKHEVLMLRRTMSGS